MNSYFSHEIISIPKAPPNESGRGDESTPPKSHTFGFPGWMFTSSAQASVIRHMPQLIYHQHCLMKSKVALHALIFFSHMEQKQCCTDLLWVKCFNYFAFIYISTPHDAELQCKTSCMVAAKTRFWVKIVQRYAHFIRGKITNDFSLKSHSIRIIEVMRSISVRVCDLLPCCLPIECVYVCFVICQSLPRN